MHNTKGMRKLDSSTGQHFIMSQTETVNAYSRGCYKRNTMIAHCVLKPKTYTEVTYEVDWCNNIEYEGVSVHCSNKQAVFLLSAFLTKQECHVIITTKCMWTHNNQ